jgi:hypothetical protein
LVDFSPSRFSPSSVSGFQHRRILVSKPITPRRFMPAGWVGLGSIVAVALVAAAGIAGSATLRAHRGNAAAGPVAAQSADRRGRVLSSLGALPLAFEANQGQTDPQVKYMARGNGYTVFLTASDTVFALQSSEKGSATAATTRVNGKQPLGNAHPTPAAKDVTAAIRMHLVGGTAHPQIAAASQLPGHSNYFIGNDRSQWHSNVAQYARVSYRDVYPGVDMAFHGEQKQLEFDFIVAPGASAAPIRLGVSGAKRIATDDAGNLVLASSAGDVLLHKPVAYQQKDGARQPVDARFVMQAHNQVSFELGNYDRSRELVIDPSVTYATYLGGSAEDDGYGIAIDSTGNAYVTGQTKSTNFPGANAANYAGGFDVFVAKISPDGSTLIYSTYVGGSGDDSGNAIAVDGSGNAFVAGGTTSTTNFPTTTGAAQTVFGGGSIDAFVFELASSGSSLTYSTYLGGNANDVAIGIALAKDNSGSVFVVGSTISTNFPGTSTSLIQNALSGSGFSNGFVTKLNSSGNAIDYSTYLGGPGDFAAAVAVDSSNNAYVTGSTQNSTFPVTSNAVQKTCGTAANCNGGLYDAFVSVIKADASGFVYSTFLGGASADQGLGIAVDGAGNAYVTGLTTSTTTFPITSGAIQKTYGGGSQDAFVTAIKSDGSAFIYSTYLGGTQGDAGAAIAVDGSGNAYVTGQTGSSTGFPVANATQATLKGGNDAFVSEINATGSQLLFSTYLGGSLNEDSTSGLSNVSPIGAIAVDSAGATIYVAGNTGSTDFPATNGAYQTNFGGGTFDAFVAKYSQTGTTANFTIANGALSATSGNPGVSATSTITVSSVAGFSSAVTLACSVAPVVTKGPTCSFSNPGSSVTPPANGSVTSTLNVATIAASAMLDRPTDHHSGMLYAMLLPVFGITLLGAGAGPAGSRRRKLFGLLMLGVVLTGLLVMPACSGSNSNTGGGNTGTPAGAYTITVTGTGGGATVTGTPALSLTVN